MDKRYIENFDTDNKSYGVLKLDNTSHQDIDSFFVSYHITFGNRPNLDKKWYEWFYTQNPAGQGKNYILVDLTNNRWIGGIGFAPKDYILKGQKKRGSLAVNGFMNTGYENKGLYSKLFAICLNNETSLGNFAFGFTHSNNFASRKALLKIGWIEYKNMVFLELKPYFRYYKDSVQVSRKTDFLQNCDIEQLNYINDFSFYRSIELLTWRFSQRPYKTYTFITTNNGTQIGYLILGYYTTTNGILRCQIIDYACNTETCLIQLINRALMVAYQESCDILDVLIIKDSFFEGIFKSINFQSREEGYNTFYYSKDSISLPNTCHVTYGDNDVA